MHYSAGDRTRSLSNSMLAKGGLLLAALLLPLAAAATGTRSNGDGSAELRIGKPHQYADVLLDTDRFSGSYRLAVRAEDRGRTADLFLVTRVNDRWFMKTADGWQPWNQRLDSLAPAATKILAAEEELGLLDDERLLAGDYRVFAAYRVDGGELVVMPRPLRFQVSDSRAGTLQRFSSPEAMADYIRDGMRNGADASWLVRTSVVSLAEGAADSAAGARVSTTNLQETGVDEADTVKTDGDNLFVLKNCDFRACLDVYGLDGAQATATQKASFALGGDLAPDGMYLVQDGPGADTLVTVAGQNQFIAWFDAWGWAGNTTEIEFFNAAQPDNLVSRDKLTLDGALVSSRRVGDTLYVVTRYTPYVDDFIPRPLGEPRKEGEASDDTLDDVVLDDLVPRVRDTRDEVLDLVRAQDCYLPVNAVDGNRDPSIITITAVPLDNPTGFQSTCFLGGSETLYMTADSLYLATTRWDYELLAADALVYNPDHTTAIHKFALESGGIAYRGSAEVKGHLGWNEDKKSFRLGENRGYLNVVTSIGDSWDETSSTRLTVLKESAFGDALETVSVIDGIGKPGEQLYAARFLGDRAYLVTFRLIDPLYVVDLSDQENPVIAGELEIDGYSDYLHPVSDTLLLGIGKDAIPDDGSFDFGGARGAWYQGVKLSLFNVADIGNPREIDAVVLGKRGTESEVLWDHHALSFLPAAGGEPARLAIPVQLHEDVPAWEGWDASDPSAWYDYTHTALYSFELSALGISQAGRIISETDGGDDFVIALDTDVADPDADADDNTGGATEPAVPVDLPTRLIAPIFNYYSDRSVLLDDAVFYIHDGDILTSFWGEDRTAD